MTTVRTLRSSEGFTRRPAVVRLETFAAIRSQICNAIYVIAKSSIATFSGAGCFINGTVTRAAVERRCSTSLNTQLLCALYRTSERACEHPAKTGTTRELTGRSFHTPSGRSRQRQVVRTETRLIVSNSCRVANLGNPPAQLVRLKRFYYCKILGGIFRREHP